MSVFDDFVRNLPNQWGDLDPDSLLDRHAYNTSLGYDKFSPEWAKEGTLGDYGKHLSQTSASGGNPFMAYTTDYRDRTNSGMSSSEALNEQYQNAGISAGILAAIFGGGSYFGDGGGSSSITTYPLEGTAQGSGATGTPTAFGGESMAASPYGEGFTLGDTTYDSAGNISSIDSGGSWFDTLGEALGGLGSGGSSGGGGGGQQSGGYDSILENMMKLSPWTVARRDPQRMAQLLAMLRGQKQGGILGY